MNRRGFIKRTALALGALVAAPVLKLAGREKTAKKPPFPRGLPPYYPNCRCSLILEGKIIAESIPLKVRNFDCCLKEKP